MKKLLDIVSYTYLPYFSGGQKSIAQFLDHLGGQSDLTVVSTLQNDIRLVKSYKLLPWLSPGIYRYINVSLVKKITRDIKSNKYDAIIWEHPYYAWLAWAVKKRTGIKTIVHAHNIEFQRFRSTGSWWWRFLMVYEKWFFKKADLIFFVAPEDRDFAIANLGVKKEKCIDIPFGVEIQSFPGDKPQLKKEIALKHGIQYDEKILLFNGLLAYKPNLDALKIILDQVNPLLLLHSSFRYRIIICGKGLPEGMNELKGYADKNVIFAGFVDDIETYFKGADIFLNPVLTGGGVKTKMVESIAFGTSVISTQSGSLGIDKNVCGEKLVVVADNDWQGFAKAVIENASNNTITPTQYYDNYFWGNIVNKAVASL